MGTLMEPVSPASSARARREKLIVILGPTASGKTALSVELAKALRTEILSGDSMLVYRGFDIGAAKPTEAERQGVAHHLIDICNPDEPYSVPLFQQQAKAIIHRLNAQGRVPILAGGTGLYNIYIMEELHSILSLGAGGSTKMVGGGQIRRAFNAKYPREYIDRPEKRRANLMDFARFYAEQGE